jgi:hypothetical protein
MHRHLVGEKQHTLRFAEHRRKESYDILPWACSGNRHLRRYGATKEDMIEAIYRDLAEIGLPLITPGELAFDLRFEEIRNTHNHLAGY